MKAWVRTTHRSRLGGVGTMGGVKYRMWQVPTPAGLGSKDKTELKV